MACGAWVNHKHLLMTQILSAGSLWGQSPGGRLAVRSGKWMCRGVRAELTQEHLVPLAGSRITPWAQHVSPGQWQPQVPQEAQLALVGLTTMTGTRAEPSPEQGLGLRPKWISGWAHTHCPLWDGIPAPDLWNSPWRSSLTDNSLLLQEGRIFHSHCGQKPVA